MIQPIIRPSVHKVGLISPPAWFDMSPTEFLRIASTNHMTYNAYLDIETTGLSSAHCDITVIGIYLVNENERRLVQLVGEDVTKENLLSSLEDAGIIYTYNGSRFDLPFIHSVLDVNLAELYPHHDLMYDCWDCNLYGGFKSVEHTLAIFYPTKR